MKLYTSIGPNPRAARIALAEKGIACEKVEVDMMKGENRTPDYIDRVSAAGTIPTLETDDGQMISEITAIAEYLDEIAPAAPPLIGATIAERAETRMWARRLDLDICIPMGIAFQAGALRKFFENRKALAPIESVPVFIAMGHGRLEWLEGRMTGDWICGDRFSWADVPLFCYLEFFQKRGAQTAPVGGWLDGWRARMRARPAADA